MGRRTTGDTMLGCGHCRRCLAGRHHVCADRYEIGIRGGWHGALAEQLLVPASSLHALPDALDDTAGAMVEPGGNAMRAVRAANVGEGDQVLVAGPGTIGLLAALFAEAAGARAHLLGPDERSLEFARSASRTPGPRRRCRTSRGTPSSMRPPVRACRPAPSTSSNPPAGSSSSGSRRPRPCSTAARSCSATSPRWASSGHPRAWRVRSRLCERVGGSAAAGGGHRPLTQAAAVLAGERPGGRGPKVHIDPRR